MAVRRSQNWINQQRVDVPHLRSIESAIRNDFDELLSSLSIGNGNSYIIRGFTLEMSTAIGAAANTLEMIVDGASLLHGASNESGTFFEVESGAANELLNATTNDKVSGAFTASSLNYIGIEFTRTVDDSTAAQLFLWNPSSSTEFSKTLPLAQTLDYEIVITNTVWASNVLPIAAVETDSANNVLSVQDRRPMLYRLGTGGAATPNPDYNYPWSGGRLENFWESTTTLSPFIGGDKQIENAKEWSDAVMTLFKEVTGNPFWYLPTSASGSLLSLRGDLDRTYTTGSGKYTHDSTTPGQINWNSDINLNFIGSRLSYKISANAATTDVTLSDNQVAYIEIVRGQDISPNLIFTNGSATVSSVGAFSWTSDIQAGDFIKLGSSDDTGYYEILSVDSVSQVTLVTNFTGTSTGAAGAKSQYAWGTYQTDPAPSNDRHVRIADREDVPFLDYVYWLFYRNDNGGGTPKIYIRGSAGGELEQGEDRSISDNTTIDVLDYIGSPNEDSVAPDYDSQTVASGSLDLPNYNGTNGENLTLRLAKVTAMLADQKQDFNIELDPGIITWDGTNITVTNAQLSIPGTTIGAAPVSINNLGSTALADNSALYVDISRTVGSALTLASAALSSLTPVQQRLVVARNIAGDLLVR